LTVLVGQALRDGLKSGAQIAAFVRQLQAGEAVFEDEASEGRTRSLAASLAYGFENAFSEAERKQLALLHLFQGFVSVVAFWSMGSPEEEWCLPEVKGLTREAGIALLDRAAEVGLLTALGGGYYRIHPALPWFFRRLFEEYYPARRTAVTRAFVEAISGLGNYYWSQYESGNRAVIDALGAEEVNLLHARSLARSNGWWDPAIATMQGLRSLYEHTGRNAEWARIVDQIVPDFVDPRTDGPLPGKEALWSLVTGYRVWLARGARCWDVAERLQIVRIARHRQRAAPALAKPTQARSTEERNNIRSLAVSLHDLSEIQRERGLPSCVDGYQEAFSLAESIQDSRAAATSAFNLGRAYAELPDICDFAAADRWYRRSLDLYSENDRMGRLKCLNQLGNVGLSRFLQATQANRPAEESLQYISQAAQYYDQALNLTSGNAPLDRAIVHNNLGIVRA
jgi:hypothetical protein